MKLGIELLAPIVEVIWDDADTTASWETVIDEKEELVHTIGFLVKETKNSYYIAHSVYMSEDNDLTFNGRVRIPKGMAKSFTILQGLD